MELYRILNRKICFKTVHPFTTRNTRPIRVPAAYVVRPQRRAPTGDGAHRGAAVCLDPCDEGCPRASPPDVPFDAATRATAGRGWEVLWRGTAVEVHPNRSREPRHSVPHPATRLDLLHPLFPPYPAACLQDGGLPNRSPCRDAREPSAVRAIGDAAIGPPSVSPFVPGPRGDPRSDVRIAPEHPQLLDKRRAVRHAVRQRTARLVHHEIGTAWWRLLTVQPIL